jgi:hypothetical protein
MAARRCQRIDVAWRSGVGLRHHPATRVKECARKITRLANNGRERNALQRLGLLAHDANQV